MENQVSCTDRFSSLLHRQSPRKDVQGIPSSCSFLWTVLQKQSQQLTLPDLHQGRGGKIPTYLWCILQETLGNWRNDHYEQAARPLKLNDALNAHHPFQATSPSNAPFLPQHRHPQSHDPNLVLNLTQKNHKEKQPKIPKMIPFLNPSTPTIL